MRIITKVLAVSAVIIMAVLFLAYDASSEKPEGIKVDKRKTALLVMDLQKHMIDPQSPLAQHAGIVSTLPLFSCLQFIVSTNSTGLDHTSETVILGSACLQPTIISAVKIRQYKLFNNFIQFLLICL